MPRVISRAVTMHRPRRSPIRANVLTGTTFEELLMNLYEAVEGCLSIEVDELPLSKEDKVIEIAV